MSVHMFKAMRHHSPLRGAVLLVSLWTSASTLPLVAQRPPQQTQAVAQATFSGRVVDVRGMPVSTSLVVLQAPDGTNRSATTDRSGRFTFQALRLGSYKVRAEKAGVHSPAMTVALSRTVAQEVQIVLQDAGTTPAGMASFLPGQAIEFSDKPNFTVAGVTDWTAVGGHGSDVTLRTSEDLTRETLTLQARGTRKSEAPAEDPNRAAKEETMLRAAVATDPRSYAANHALGEFYLRYARYQEAISSLKAASDLHQAQADDEFNLALACRGIGDPSQARQHVAHALAQKDAADFHRLAGELDEELGNPLAAVQEEERATQINPSEENYFVWGSELLLHRAIWQAVEVFANGAKAHPSSARMKTGWGAALFAGARYDEAAQRLCDASDLEPANSDPYLFIGKITLAAPGTLPCVQQKLERFLQLQPRNANANYFYAMFLLKQRNSPDLQRSTSLLRSAVALNSGYSEAYLQLGILEFNQRNYSEAINLYTKAVEANPQQAEAHYRLGVAYDRTGKPEQARQEFQRHDQLVKTQAEAIEQQRRQVKQFLVVVLQEKPADSATP